MADLERLKRALQAAHAAGDTAAATNLAKAIRASQSVPTNPEGTGVGRAVKRGAVQTAATVPTMLATADLRALTDVNRSPDAIRYDEALRSGVPNQAFASRAASMSDPKQVNSMMQQYGVSPQANINYQQVVQKRIENREDAAKNPAEYLKRLSANSETAGRLFKLAESFERSPTADAYAQSLAEAPDSFMGWLGTVTDDPLGFMAFMGETIAESVPQIAAGAATTTVTGSPVAGAAVMSLGGLGREYANEVNNFLRKNGVDLSDPEATKKLFSNKSLMDEANERGLTRGLVVAAADFAGQGLVAQQIIRKTLKRQTVAQGGSEAAGEALATQAVGDDFSAKDTIIEGLAGAGSIFGEATVSRTLFNKDGNLKDPDTLDDTQRQSAGDLARTFKAIIDANPDFNLKDVNKTSAKGARAVVDQAHIQLTEALKQRFADMKARVKPNQTDTFESVSEKILASAAYREGRNKTKSIVGNQELDALKRLAGDTREGQEAVNLILQLNQLTELHNSGYQGGLSSFTDQFSILGSKVGYDKSAVATERLLRPLVTGSAALKTGGLSLIGQGVTSISGRAIDKLTGNYSQIDKFVRRNSETPGLSAPTAPSLRDAAAAQIQAEEDATQREEALRTAREAEQRELNLQFARDNADPTQGSPQYTLEDATGLGRAKVAQILRILKAQNNNPALIRAIQDYEQSIATGGIVDDKMLSPLIRAVRDFQQSNPDYVPLDFVPDSRSRPELAQFATPEQAAQIGTQGAPTPDVMSQAPEFGPQFTTQENYNRGIEANQAMNAELVEGVTTDPELNRVQKGRLITSLDVLANNLGSDPVAAAREQVQKLEDAGVPQEAIDMYVKPYVDRVMQQQASRQFRPTGEGPRGLAAAQAAGVAPTSETQAPTQPDVEAPRKQLALPLFETPLAIEGKPTVRKIGEAMNKDHMDKVGRQLFPENSPEDYNQVLGFAEEELIEQLKQPNSGVGWYSKDVDESMRLASKVFPTLKDNQEHRHLYLTFAGIFSNGSDPDNAFIMSSWAFEDFLRTGKIPVIRAEGYYEQGLEPPKTTFKETKTGKMITKDAGWGIRNQANEQQLGMLRYLVEREGSLKGAMDFLLTPQKRSDINDVMLKSGLYKNGRFKTQKEKAGPDEFGFLAFGKKLGRYSLGLHGVEVEAGDTTIDLWYTRTYRRWTGRLLETPIGKEGVAAQPTNDTERDVIFKITGELANKYDLPVGDVQALLWFFEKRTWGAQGLNTKEGTNSSGARKLLRERGIDPDAANDGTGGNGTDPQVGQSPKRTGFDAAPAGAAGILTRSIKGNPPQSGQPNIQRSNPPTTQEVKVQSPVAKASITIGKKGSKWENGVRDMAGAIEIADAYNVTYKLYNHQQDLLNDNPQADEGAFGLYYGISNRIVSMSPGAIGPDGNQITEFGSYIMFLHELSHAIASRSAKDGSLTNDTRVSNGLTGMSEIVPQDTLEAMFAGELNKSTPESRKILAELLFIQDYVGLSPSGAFVNKGIFPDPTPDKVPMRRLRYYTEAYNILKRKMFNNGGGFVDSVVANDLIDRAKRLKDFELYQKSIAELSVDPMILYNFDPKFMKRIAPTTAARMQKLYKDAGNTKFILFSHPFAMGLAVILASLLKQKEDDERRQQAIQQQAAMMPPGALNAPMASGMLSAQQA
jgi:hypothetical protein